MKSIRLALLLATPAILQAQTEYTTDGTPTALEEEIRWLLNRGRYDSARENQERSTDYSDIPAYSGPLAPHQSITTAARRHSEDMARNDVFQHPTIPGSAYYDPSTQPGPADRMQAEGYNYSIASENIAGGYQSALAAFVGWWNSTGHRTNMFATNRREIGNGYYVHSPSTFTRYYTMNMGSRSGTHFFTSTAFNDANSNGKYDQGEGVPNIKVVLRINGNDLATFDISESPGSFAIPIQSINNNATVEIWLTNNNLSDVTLHLPVSYDNFTTVPLAASESRLVGTFSQPSDALNIGFRDISPSAPPPTGPPEITVEQPVGNSLEDEISEAGFGTVTIGSSSSLTFTIRNDGAGSLSELAMAVDGTNQADFTVDALPTTSLSAGESTSFSVNFSPSAVGGADAFLRISSNDDDENPFDIRLGGIGEAAPRAPVIVITDSSGNKMQHGESSVVYDDTPVGSLSPYTFTISNDGDANLTGLVMSLTGNHPSDFTVTSPSASQVIPGASTTFQLSFRPSALGVRTASIRITSNDSDKSPFIISLTGTATPGVPSPEIEVVGSTGDSYEDESSTVSFGDASTRPTSREFTIVNSGTGSLFGLALNIDGAHSGDFTAGRLLVTGLAPGSSTTFSIAFEPQGAGSRSAFLRISSNDSDESPFDIALTGSAPAVQPGPKIALMEGRKSLKTLTSGKSKSRFKTTRVGRKSKTVTFHIQNHGSAILNKIRPRISGKHRKDFKLQRKPRSKKLAAGESTPFTLRFAPNSRGKKKALLRVHSNDRKSGPFRVTLLGKAPR